MADNEIEMNLLHYIEGGSSHKTTKVKLKQSTDKDLKQQVLCNTCDEEIEVNVKSANKIKFRYIMILLPSLLLGGYFITMRAINEGLDTLILSLIIYTLFGFIGYLILMSRLLKSFLSASTVKTTDHNISS